MRKKPSPTITRVASARACIWGMRSRARTTGPARSGGKNVRKNA